MSRGILNVTDEIYELAAPQVRKMIDARRTMSLQDAAEHLGLNVRYISTAIGKLLKKAALKGIAPAQNLDHPTIPGFDTKRVSTAYGSDGKIVLQWHIQEAEKTKQAALIKEYVLGLCKDLTPIEISRPDPEKLDPKLLNLYTLTDVHIGMLAWDKEGGDDWDVDIATKTVKAIFTDMMERAPKTERCIINQGGDWSHYDSMQAVTPASGHMLDADSRPSKMAHAAGSLIRFLITEALKRHSKVTVVLQEGNHDVYSHKKDVDWAVAWGEILTEAWGIPKDRLEFITNEVPYYAVRFGKNMIAFHHGHKRQAPKLPQLFACQFREMWGSCKFVDIHKGHYHCLDITEQEGATVIQHPSIVAADAYSSHNGYFSNRAAMSITYHADFGRQGMTFSTPEMVGLG